ncbi:MAG: ABC transporter substrate-binding protein [Candidatus Sericytochromatia bacterium]|nr:ABC transporter substrate-binding protein [Candidatus Sericytochromatia bacterium]
MYPPQRIVCLTEETVETLYLLGEQARIVGISHYVVRPPEAPKEKPRVSAFLTAQLDKIAALEPDLVLAFSDIQADICQSLIKQGLNVHCFNQRTLAEILDSIRLLGAMVGAGERAARLADDLAARVQAARERAAARGVRPRVYFEEWDEPMISGIAWVSELIEAAGGDDIFAGRSAGRLAKERFVTPEEVLAAQPQVVLASWCGKRFRRDQFEARPGFADLPAVRDGHVTEIEASIILQPGPAALTDGLAALEACMERWAADRVAPA